MRTSSSIQSLCRSIFNYKPLFSNKTQSLSKPFNGFVFLSTTTKKLSDKFWCHSLASSDEIHTPIALSEKLGQKSTGDVKSNDNNNDGVTKLSILKEKAETFGILYDDSIVPGHFYNFPCPQCKGGHTMERSLSFHIMPKGDIAMWRCFRFDCGWFGRVYVDESKIRKPGEPLTEELLDLIPLNDELLAYFRNRMISEETLHRNKIMRLSDDDRQVIAFTYRREGVITGCKYRTIDKKFWREKDTEKVLYGLDDIVDSDEIIIVEGEIDKLSVEEAGFRNCVSVPDGAPFSVTEELPSREMDIKFMYLWNCKEYLDKASRIIIATDSDRPGQSLAEELARRLGKHRCWQVSWPKKDEFSLFKDANEVLRSMGPNALKNIIEGAELYSQSMYVNEEAQVQ